MKQERIYQVLLGPHISEKATIVADGSQQVVFRVAKELFNVKVKGVNVLNAKGKTKRTQRGLGKRSDVRKAYVALADGSEIDFLGGE